jgi:hypothetical protein
MKKVKDNKNENKDGNYIYGHLNFIDLSELDLSKGLEN